MVVYLLVSPFDLLICAIKCRKGSRFGHDSLVDGMLKDGLWDVYGDCAMGVCAELCADNHAPPREDQVAFHYLQ